ncbi:protein crossbronx-like [Scaptodrosophila lebanonensis]|uniref:Protein crossbronx-like n=1 Tax=Drosophila lebanonensis TaxID=7225 RepID=A0A6J2TTM0_DROLE|nr:protein crossbronx-like [Scaptodrosophila lebanonensis]
MCLETPHQPNKVLDIIRQGYIILAEYNLIEQEQLRGIYAIPSYSSGVHWFGVIFIRSGLYAESMFRFSILLPDNFPDDVVLPTVIFQTDVFHPLICPVTHSLDLTSAFREWRKDEHHIWHLLRYIQAIFADPEGSVCSAQGCVRLSQVIMGPHREVHNMDALRLLARSRMEYLARVQQGIEWSVAHMYDDPPTDDPHYIVFEPYNPTLHQHVLECLKSRSWHDPVASSSLAGRLKVVRSKRTPGFGPNASTPEQEIEEVQQQGPSAEQVQIS